MLCGMDLDEMFDYIADLVGAAAHQELLGEDDSAEPDPADDTAFELRKLELISRARLVLEIMEAQVVHHLRTSIPAIAYGEIGEAQGISKQASRVRHAKLEQILRVYQFDGRRHSLAKVAVSAKHRRAARPTRRSRRQSDPA